MTKDEVLNATHEQLRVWVAERVMEWTDIVCYAADEDLWGQPPGWTGDAGLQVFQELPDYPGNWGAAGQVVEKMQESHMFSLNASRNRASASFMEGGLGKVTMADADTVPHAVCLAALKTGCGHG